MIPLTEVQQRILDAALKEFSVYGLSGARIDNIAKSANINKAMIFYYFNSKENLYQLVVKRVFDQVFPSISDIIQSNPTPEQWIERAVNFYIQIFSKNTDFVRMIGMELIQNPANITSAVTKVFKERGENQVGPPQVIKMIEKWAAEDKITEKDPFHFMLNIISLSILSILGKPFIENMFRLDPHWTPPGDDFYEKRYNSIVNLLKRGMLP